MPHTSTNHRRRPAATVFILVLACLGLAACGSSSSSSTTTVAANAARTTTGAGGTTGPGGTTPGPASGRFTALRACLQKEGITLPERTPGQRRTPGSGGFLGGGPGGGPQLPKGVTRAQFEAALKKCGGGRPFGGRARFANPAFHQTLTAYAACLRENGVNVPAPNTSGNGPVFDTKGINTAGAQFRAAQMKCQSILRNGFRARGGALGAGGAGAAGA